MKEVLSPKDLAAAIGVSESSLKRWADKGQVKSTRTPGGHRRIPISEAIRFIRSNNVTIVRPELLGLASEAVSPSEDVGDALYEMLYEGKAREARSLLMTQFLQGASLAEIFDGPLKAALHRLGELWLDNRQGIFVEHRATEICLEAIRELRQAVEDNPSAPIAIGGASEGEIHSIPTLMAGTILLEERFHAVNLGGATPLDALENAAEELNARLIWLSVTVPTNPSELEMSLAQLAESCRQNRRGLAVGGQWEQTAEVAKRHGIHYCDSMTALASFARGLRSTL